MFIGAFIPKDIKDYILGMEFMSFSFNFIPFDKIPILNSVIEWVDSQQEDNDLKDIGANSNSSFVNNFSLIIMIVLLIITHLAYLPVYYSCRNKLSEKQDSKLSKICNKIFYFLTLSVYVRMFLESNQFILLTTSSEIYNMDSSTNANLVSLNIAFVVL